MIITLLFLLAPFLPLAMAVAMVPRAWRPHVSVFLPVAPLPALMLAIFAAPDASVFVRPVLLGLVLGLDETRQMLLMLSALLWVAAAVYSRGYLVGDRGATRYTALFLVTMGGNLGLIVALDVAAFYVFFSLMTLSSYILVVHERTEKAYAAGRAYIVLSVLGETLLLLGFLRAVSEANSLMIADIAPALADEGAHTATLLLLFSGFAIKAGQLPLHVWLPLAHPAAPTPASAVLSGAMIKAGLLGMILFLPFGQAALPGLGSLLTAIGIVTAFYGVLCGLPQRDPKTVLAYSSVSQMGVMVAALGAALAAPAAVPAIVPAVVLYAVHHGLAKGALFFSVGVVQRARRARSAGIVIAGLCALAVAGLPVSAGALAKLVAKAGLETAAGGPSVLLIAVLPLSALATALLMLRFLFLLGHTAPRGEAPAGPVEAALWGPFVVTAAASQLLPWLNVLQDGAPHAALAWSGYALWESTWPVALAAALAVAAARWASRFRLPAIPEGDWIALIPSMQLSADVWSLGYMRTVRVLSLPHGLATLLLDYVGRAVERAEAEAQGSTRGAAAAILLLGLLLAMALI
jgi:formate hydrogenlyase subunit 3/multisubunit Na+/H+ antiporter MnhD subunit